MAPPAAAFRPPLLRCDHCKGNFLTPNEDGDLVCGICGTVKYRHPVVR